VEFLGVDLQDDQELARDLMLRAGVTYELAVDPDGSLFPAVGGAAQGLHPGDAPAGRGRRGPGSGLRGGGRRRRRTPDGAVVADGRSVPA
jgi:hypothetical protein